MSAAPLLTTDDLRQWSGYQRQADVRRWLDEHGVPYLVARGGPVTTVSAVESVLGVRPSTAEMHGDWRMDTGAAFIEENDEELERVRGQLSQLRETYDAEMEFRAEKRAELGATETEGFDTFLRRICAELAALRERYRPRKQSEEPAPKDAVVLVRGIRGRVWSTCLGRHVANNATWTNTPPPDGEGE